MTTTFDADLRAACVQLLSDYADSAGVKLQVWPARPTSLFPPTAFVDRIGGPIDVLGITSYQRHPAAEVVVVHGAFDTAQAVAQRDAFVDGFFEWVRTRYHAAGANTLIALRSMDDEPAWTPDWTPANTTNISFYYATRITLEGFAGG